MICPHCHHRIFETSRTRLLRARIGNMRRRGVCTSKCATEARGGLIWLVGAGAKSPTRLKANNAGLLASWWRGDQLICAVLISARGHGHVDANGSWVRNSDWMTETLRRLTHEGMVRDRLHGHQTGDRGNGHQESTDVAIEAGRAGSVRQGPGYGSPPADPHEGGAPAGFSRGPLGKSRGKQT